MSMYSVDIEADGPVPGEDMYSMVALGMVRIAPGLNDRLLVGPIRPISIKWDSEALAVSGLTRKECEGGVSASQAMAQVLDFVTKTNQGGRPIFLADNPGFDFAFINWYCHRFLRQNPFGWSSFHLGSFYKGLERDLYGSFKHLRRTKHDHNPLNDAIGNAEAFLSMLKEGFLRVPSELHT